LRLGVSGKYGDNLKYKLEAQTDSTGEVTVEDAYMQWAPTGGDLSFKAGQFRTPNSLDNETSSRFGSTYERAAFTSAFGFDRRLGVAAEIGNEKYRLTAGAFSENLNANGQKEGFALAARGTVSPKLGENGQLHLGASVRYRDIGDSQGDIRYAQRPFAHIPGRILSTGGIARKDKFVGAEGAAIMGPVFVAGEYARTFIQCSAAAQIALTCVGDPSVDGGYAEAGVFFGGKKGYKDGKFDRPSVDNPVTKGGSGAFAFTARFDTLDLDATGVDGGSFNSYILGAEWWPTKYTRVGVNLFKVDADLGSSTSGLDPAFAGLVTALTPGEDVKGAVIRAQFDF